MAAPSPNTKVTLQPHVLAHRIAVAMSHAASLEQLDPGALIKNRDSSMLRSNRAGGFFAGAHLHALRGLLKAGTALVAATTLTCRVGLIQYETLDLVLRSGAGTSQHP